MGAGAEAAITSTQSSTGHPPGAAGGIEAIVTIRTLRDQVVPSTLNLINPCLTSANSGVGHLPGCNPLRWSLVPPA
ncbi:hypothetical protein [Zobellella sp. DQSA1]|uniref:hypothetical protein n=1 Tax=Zobellella sp. DQSA1 TaxID=3342386 RepID=UPI0035C08AA5